MNDTTWSEWELDEETSPAYRYQAAPTNLVGTDKPLTVEGYGRAEIKPHNLAGIGAGMRQLEKFPAGRPRVLLTYRPLDTSNAPATAGLPATVQVFATHYVPSVKPAAVLSGQTWWLVGTFTPKPMIAVNLENRGVFGAAMETDVRELFKVNVLVPSKRAIWKHTGGSQRGADVRWNELAEMYHELAKQLNDPLYAELAAELTAPLR